MTCNQMTCNPNLELVQRIESLHLLLRKRIKPFYYLKNQCNVLLPETKLRCYFVADVIFVYDFVLMIITIIRLAQMCLWLINLVFEQLDYHET